ncbi:MAG: hypothetical protein J0L74_00895, partial [Burkholderiales bacterium]|nr:hypothetical protein [Burkholderiales bacterium]
FGFSPTGEAFNLRMEEVATSVAIALHADKLLFLTEVPGIRIRENGGQMIISGRTSGEQRVRTNALGTLQIGPGLPRQKKPRPVTARCGWRLRCGRLESATRRVARITSCSVSTGNGVG